MRHWMSRDDCEFLTGSRPDSSGFHLNCNLYWVRVPGTGPSEFTHLLTLAGQDFIVFNSGLTYHKLPRIYLANVKCLLYVNFDGENLFFYYLDFSDLYKNLIISYLYVW